MKLIIDTHVLLWWLDDPAKLSSQAYKAISSEASQVFVSAATMWEIAIKVSIGKLVIPETDLRPAIDTAGFEELPVMFAHAIAYFSLATHHRDPFDRMLIAQALTEQGTLVTRDREIAKYEVPIILA